MALKAGRVGVAKDQVDEFGKIVDGGTPENVYTKTQCDNKFETKTHANNTYQPKTIEVPLELLGGSQLTVETSLHAIEDTFGTLRFRNNDGTPQVKTPSGEWANFNSGGSDTLGFNIPESKLITTGLRASSNVTIVSGGYCIENDILYVDVTFTNTSATQSSGLMFIDDISSANIAHDVALYTPTTNSYNAGLILKKNSNGVGVAFAIMNAGIPANTPYRVYGEVKLNNV